jgi:membrane-bound lytic murein transglycosylase B
LTYKLFAIATLIFAFSPAASAAERFTDSAEAAPSNAPTIVAIPNGTGITVEAIPSRFSRLIDDFRDAARAALDEEIVPVVHAKSVTRTPATPRELSFDVTPEIRTFLSYYTAGRGRGTAIRGVFRSAAYRDDARRIFREEGVPVDLIWLAQVESVWQPTAVSPVGASGVWQFMPATAERFGMKATGDADDERMDFEKATRGAAKYLHWLGKRYDGNWPLAIGAYNCGEGAMDKAIAKAGVEDFWAIARGGYLPKETANYVPAVLAASVFGSDPSYYELDNRYAVTMELSRDSK